jgi:hypothetical protein
VTFTGLSIAGLGYVQQKAHQSSHASWLKTFSDLPTLAKDSVIVTGKITGPKSTRLIGGDDLPADVKAEIEKDGGVVGVMFTDYIFAVDNVIKGDKIEPGQSIVIVQTGGTFQGRTQSLEDDPLFQSGEIAVLFLKDISNDPIQSPGETKYIINGSPQARYKVESGQVKPLWDDEIGHAYRGKTIDEFVKAIRTALTMP